MHIILKAVISIFIVINITFAAEFRDVTTVDGALESLQDSQSSVSAKTPNLLAAQTAEALQFEDGSKLQVKIDSSLPYNLGRSIRFYQTLNNIPIKNAEVVIRVSENDKIIDIFGQAAYELTSVLDIDKLRAVLTEQEALLRAKKHNVLKTKAPNYVTTYEDEEVSLIYFMENNGDLTLAYYVSFLAVTQSEDVSVDFTLPVYIIEVQNGEILDFYDNLLHMKKGIGPGGNRRTKKYEWGIHPLPKFEVSVEEGEEKDKCLMDSEKVVTGMTYSRSKMRYQGPWTFACYENPEKV